MKPNYKHLGMYLLAGGASGLLCRLTYTNDEIWEYVGPALVLGLMITFSGRYISGIAPRNTWFGPVILILFCLIGWFLAVEHGANGGLYLWPLESGVIGGFFVGTGLAIGWKLTRAWLAIVQTAAAGGLGGMAFAVSDFFGFEEFPLFVVWQGVVFLSIGLAIQIDLRKSSAGM